MLTVKIVFLALAAVISSVHGEIKEEEGVLVLTKDNFQSAISDNEYILVEFYAPWCGHCKALTPEYIQAASILKEKHPDIKLAKVDATVEAQLAEEHNVRGYPTLQFFRKGSPIQYTGGRKAEEIVSWLVMKTGPVTKPLTTADEVKTFRDENEVVVVGFFDDDSEASNNFKEVAFTVDTHLFGVVSDKSLMSELGFKDDDVVLFKKFDDAEPVVYSGEHNQADLKSFIATESLPLIVEFTAESSKKIFRGDIKSHLLLFLSRKAGHFDKILDEVKPAAKENRKDILYVTFDVDEPEHERILEYFGIQKSNIPEMRIIRLEDELVKFKPEKDELSSENIKQFVSDYLSGKVKEHLLAQELPEDWNKGPVTVLVSQNFDEVVFDKEKNVLVEFYAPWCTHCKNLVPIYEKLGKHFESDDDVVIAKMDATANELDHTKIENFPTIKLYTKGENKVIPYLGERNLESLIKFVESGGKTEDSPQTEEEDEDEDLPPKDEL